MRIKICGITSERDAHAAVEAGADALGFVFYPKSPRAVTPLQAMAIARSLPPFVARVGVFVNLPPAEIRSIRSQAGLTALQLHGDESPVTAHALPGAVIKAFRGAVACQQVFEYQTAGYLLDGDAGERYGGAGLPADEAAASALAGDPRFILSGGLNPDNVAERIRRFPAGRCRCVHRRRTGAGPEMPGENAGLRRRSPRSPGWGHLAGGVGRAPGFAEIGGGAPAPPKEISSDNAPACKARWPERRYSRPAPRSAG